MWKQKLGWEAISWNFLWKAESVSQWLKQMHCGPPEYERHVILNRSELMWAKAVLDNTSGRHPVFCLDAPRERQHRYDKKSGIWNATTWEPMTSTNSFNALMCRVNVSISLGNANEIHSSIQVAPPRCKEASQVNSTSWKSRGRNHRSKSDCISQVTGKRDCVGNE